MLIFKGFFEQKDGEIIGVASTQTADRDGEVIIQAGWQLDNFRKNPVILAGHDYWSFPVGKATEILIEGSRLLFKMVFATTEKGQEAMQLVKEGVLSAFSVGFIPKTWSDADTIAEAELLEISLVSVPANPEAVVLAKGMKGNKLAKAFTDEWMQNKNIKDAVESVEGDEKKDDMVVPVIEPVVPVETVIPNDPEMKEVKDGETFSCECGKSYTLKFTTQADEAKEGEDGDGRAAADAEKQVSNLVLGALKLLQKARKIENREEDRK